jgi:SagB-type dehydrogenase family enzyme
MTNKHNEPPPPQLSVHYHVNNDIFFVFENDCVLTWDYRKHQQFLLNLDYFKELQLIASTGHGNDASIDKELLAANLISEHPYPETKWGWDVLSKIYHIGCQNVGELETGASPAQLAEDYLEYCKQLANNMPNLYTEKPGKLIDLPPPDTTSLNKIPYFDVLKQRKTSRSFNAEPITLEQLSTMLFASFGLIHGEWDEFKDLHLQATAIRKASPASGGLHSEETYVVAYRINGLENGLYHYRPQDHKLTLLQAGNFEDKVISMNMSQFYSKGLACGIYITSRLDKIWWKYKHSKAYRVTMLDIGHVSQTTLLTATALQLKTWMTGAFRDAELEGFLGIDGIKETAVFFIGIGKGSGKAIPDEFLAQFG